MILDTKKQEILLSTCDGTEGVCKIVRFIPQGFCFSCYLNDKYPQSAYAFYTRKPAHTYSELGEYEIVAINKTLSRR